MASTRVEAPVLQLCYFGHLRLGRLESTRLSCRTYCVLCQQHTAHPYFRLRFTTLPVRYCSQCANGRTIRAQCLTILAPLWPPSRSCLGIFGLCDWAEDSGRVSPSEICTSQICTKFVKSPMAALRLRRASPPDRNPPLSRSLAEAAVPSAGSAKGGA